jgi:hypothetical protein
MRPTEPTLDEMLADPIVRLLMLRDGVRETDVRGLVERLRHRPAVVSPAPMVAERVLVLA